MKREALPVQPMVSIEELTALAERASGVVAELRKRMLLPEAKKSPPSITSERLQALCGITKSQMQTRVGKGVLPPGHVPVNGGRREFTLAEAQEWTRAHRPDSLRPNGARAVTITVGFFKGGTGKSSTSMTLAQGLSLKSHRVLLVDLDPQGTLTTLNGILPDTDVDEGDTLSNLFFGEAADVRYAIRPTYWHGIDLIPASPALFSAEFALPARQTRDRSFAFWNALNEGLEAVRDHYDVVIIDTPPSLSYMTINAFFAADGVLVPMTPSMLDVSSSAQFWNLFSDLAGSISRSEKIAKAYDFVHVLMNRVDSQDSATRAVREVIATIYGAKVLPIEIPKTAVASATAVEFATVYDLSRYEGSHKTYARARDAYDQLVELMELSINQVWARQLANAA